MAKASVTAGLICASELPNATAVKIPQSTPNAQPAVITIHPPPSALERLSKTFATTPSPSRMSTSVPANSPTKGECISPRSPDYLRRVLVHPIKRARHCLLPCAIHALALLRRHVGPPRLFD